MLGKAVSSRCFNTGLNMRINYRNHLRALLVCCGVTALGGSYALAAAEQNAAARTAENAVIRAYFAPMGADNGPSPDKQSDFDCTEPIFTVLELSEYPAGKHHLGVKWIDPSRNVREHTQYSFGVSESGQTKLWAWLELSPATGAALISWLNPAAGLEEFVGTWDVEIKINNRLIAARQFDVTC